MIFSRRQIFAGIGALACFAAMAAGAGPAAAQSENLAELMKPGPLPEKSMGSAQAPVTIIEYASMTCSHCADFHNETYPELKSKYIDTGKVRYILREFPLDSTAVGAFMLARCSGEKYFPLVEAMFEQQKSWLNNPFEGLMRITKQAGFTEKSFEDCVNDEKLAKDVQEIAKRGAEQFGVRSTPTFFINGKKVAGAISIKEMDKLIEPLLKTN